MYFWNVTWYLLWHLIADRTWLIIRHEVFFFTEALLSLNCHPLGVTNSLLIDNFCTCKVWNSLFDFNIFLSNNQSFELTCLNQVLCSGKTFLGSYMKSGGCNDETGIHITHACSSDGTGPTLPLNSSNHGKSWSEYPWYGVELLPEPGKHQLDVESEDKGNWNHLLKVENVQHYTFKLFLLLRI